MRLDISRVLTHDNYTLEFDCSEDFSARETADGSRPFAAVRVYGTVRMRYDGVRLQATIEAPCTAPLLPLSGTRPVPSGRGSHSLCGRKRRSARRRRRQARTSPEKRALCGAERTGVRRAAVRLSEQGALQRRLQGPVPRLRLQPQYRAVFLCVRRVGKSLSAFCILLFPMRRCHRCHKKERRPKPGEICVAPAFETGSAGAHQVRPVRRIDSGSQSL